MQKKRTSVHSQSPFKCHEDTQNENCLLYTTDYRVLAVSLGLFHNTKRSRITERHCNTHSHFKQVNFSRVYKENVDVAQQLDCCCAGDWVKWKGFFSPKIWDSNEFF